MKDKKLRPYMASGPDSEEGAFLVFAYTARQARNISYPELSDWGIEFLDTRVVWMKGKPHLFEEADQEKLAAGIPHFVNPKCCASCEQWGSPVDEEGICRNCRDEEASENV